MPVDPERIQFIFLAAIEHDAPADRSAARDRECGLDAEQRRRVAALLRAHNDPDSRLDRPLVGGIVSTGPMATRPGAGAVAVARLADSTESGGDEPIPDRSDGRAPPGHLRREWART
jgi:hypothetical protein